ncbi:MAG: AbrB/MazE/SpoVT family DNA-binding domain-containing protein [Burkholderiales bacterium]
MLKRIAKIGNSQGLIFDSALRELTGLAAGDQVNVTVHEGGAIVIAPMRPAIGADEARGRARKLIRRNNALFKRLA